MWLLLLFISMFGLLSQVMMSYLAMYWSLGPWVGPLFVVVCMALAIPLVSRKWFTQHAIITISAGFIGGIIGLSLGLTLPLFYFLHKAEFSLWLEQPLLFSAGISLLVLCAGSFAFLISYMIKDHVIIDENLRFPMSKLVYDIVSVDTYSDMHRFMWIGIAISSIWNVVLFLMRSLIKGIIAQVQMIPLLISVGFVAGYLVAIPIFIGMLHRIMVVKFLHVHFFNNMHHKEFLVIFCLGMLCVHIAFVTIQLFKDYSISRIFDATFMKFHLLNRYFMMISCITMLMSGVVLYWFNIQLLEMFFLFFVLLVIGQIVARIMGEVGIIDIEGFVWCVLLPLLYGATISSINLLIVALFVAVCLGIIVDLMFSYKLTSLARISYRHVLPYQLVGFGIAVITCGYMMWWYAQAFDEESLYFFTVKIQELDALIKFGFFDSRVFMLGVLSGICILLTSRLSLLCVIGATLMDPITSMWLAASGFASYFVSNRERWYPLWFGIYAAHALWVFMFAVL